MWASALSLASVRDEHASLLLSGWKVRDKTENGEEKDIVANSIDGRKET